MRQPLSCMFGGGGGVGVVVWGATIRVWYVLERREDRLGRWGRGKRVVVVYPRLVFEVDLPTRPVVVVVGGGGNFRVRSLPSQRLAMTLAVKRFAIFRPASGGIGISKWVKRACVSLLRCLSRL